MGLTGKGKICRFKFFKFDPFLMFYLFLEVVYQSRDQIFEGERQNIYFEFQTLSKSEVEAISRPPFKGVIIKDLTRKERCPKFF